MNAVPPRVTQRQPPEPSESGGSKESSQPDDQAWAGLFAQHYTKLVKSLVARTRSWDEARDIASQAFVEVLTQRPGSVSFLGPYLYRTARNLALNRLNHRAMLLRKESIVCSYPAEQISPESEWAQHERIAVLHRAVGALAPRLRMAIILRIWDELSYEEIAQRFAELGVQINVRTLQRYMAEALKQCRLAM